MPATPSWFTAFAGRAVVGWRSIGAIFLLAFLTACESDGPGPEQEAVIGQRTYLLDLPPRYLGLDGHRGVLPDPQGYTVEKIICKADVRRGLLLHTDAELVFHDVIPAAARLVFEVGFGERGGPSPTRFEVQVTAGPNGRDRQEVWTGEVARPPAEPWRWTRVEVDLASFEAGDVAFRVRSLDGSKEPGTALPAIANPVLEGAGRSVKIQASRNRNLVVFLVDTLRADHLGCYGYGRDTSPRLDALAAESLLFLDAAATSSWTKASVASLFTARYPSQHGAEGYTQRMSDAPATLAEVLGAKGYACAAIGHSEWIFNPIFNVNKGFHETYYVLHGSALNHTPANRVVDEALAWLDRNYELPFFLYVHTVDPHAPYTPEQDADYFQERPYEGELTPTNLGPNSFLRRSADQITDEDLRYLVDLYDAEIRFNDAQIGRFMDRLKELGLWDETTFVVVSDHGEEFLDHDGWSHGETLYQEQLRVPLIVKPPRSRAVSPARVEAPISATELAPALCDLLQIDATDAGWSTVSLADRVSGSDGAAPPILGELNKGKRVGYSLRRGAVKYIWSLEPDEREEIYRLDRDPMEQEDLLDEVEPGVLKSLRETMQVLRLMTVRGGLLLAFENRSDGAVEVVARLTSEQGITDFNLEDAERGADAAVRSADGSTLNCELTLEVGDRDALLVRVGPEDVLELEVSGPDGRWPPEALRLGPDWGPAPAPCRFRLSDIDDADTGPRPEDLPRLTAHLTRRTPVSLKLSAEVLEDLRAMGYVVGSDEE